MIDAKLVSKLATVLTDELLLGRVILCLSEHVATEEARKGGARERTRRWRDRHSDVTVTRHGDACPPPKEKNQTPLPPVANATALVWQDCVPLLTSLGLPERLARSNVGRWLKGHTPEAVRSAIEAAVGAGTGDPVPYVTKILRAGASNVVPLSFRPEPKKISNEEWKRMKEQGNETSG